MNVYRVKTASILPLGKQGENLARKIQFDISRWIGSFGPGTVQLLHQRIGDETPYPVAVEQEGNLAVWTVTSADTAAAGTGRAELQYYVGDALAKSETWMTKVLAALGPASETPPEAQQGWVDQVLQAGTAAAEAADRAENAAVRQPIVGSNGNWWTWDLDAGSYADTGIYSGGDAPYIGANGNWYVGQTDTGVSATGPAGQDGAPGAPGPALSVTNTASVGQTVKITAVDENGHPTEWEAVDMAEQVQSDWNQNDDTQLDYVKNRPFYTNDQEVETVLVEESTVPFVEDMDVYVAELPPTFEATAGETYKVSWDGTVYECTSARAEGEGAFTFGNLYILGMGYDTGEPFIIGVLNGKVILIYTQDTSSSHTVSISRIGDSVVKLDEKYLPDNIATKSDVEVAQTTANSAKTTAENAQNTAKNAQTAANEAKDKVAKALTVDSTGSIHAPTVGMDGGTYQELRLTSKDGYHGSIFKLTKSTGLQILVTRDGGLNGTQVNNPATIEFIANGSNRIRLKGINELIMNSSTPDSTKKFIITLDDDYNVSATNTSNSVSKTLATTEYVDSLKSNPLNITGAAIGQTVKITAVDKTGQPTEWEAVDMLSGGGGGSDSGLALLAEYPIDADTLSYTYTVPDGIREIFVIHTGNSNALASGFSVFGVAASGQMSFGGAKPLKITDFGSNIVIDTCRTSDNLATRYNKAAVAGNRDIVITYTTVSGTAIQFWGR